MPTNKTHRYAPLLAGFMALLLAACRPMAGDGLSRLVLVPPSPTTRAPIPTRSPRPTVVLPTPLPVGSATPDPVHAAARTAESVAWLTFAGLGPAAPATETLDQLDEAAQREGHVVLYADTARAVAAIQSFMHAYPAIEAEAHSSDSYDTYIRLTEDLRSGKPKADLYLVSDAPRTLALFDAKRLWNYLPPDLTPVLAQGMQEPLLVHHWTALMLICGGSLSQTNPITSWWDLTLPQWRGRITLPDPIENEPTLYLFVTLAQHGEEMADAYRDRFGRELALDADCPNAGYQWIKDILANKPLLLPGSADVAARVGSAGSQESWLGLCSYEQYAKVSQGKLAFTVLPDVAPAAGLKWPTYLGILDRCAHPQAAKLLVRWLMADATGKGGYAPWYEPGLYSSRIDMPDPQGAIPRQDLESRLWTPDYDFINAHLQAVRDHIAAHIGRPVGGR